MEKTKTLITIAALCLSGLASQAAMIAYYDLNETSGSATDSSGNNYTGAVANAGTNRTYGQASVTAGTYGAITVSSTQAAAYGTSIDFGTDAANFGNYTLNAAGKTAVDALLEPGTGGNRVNGQMTLMAWVNLDSTSGTQSIFSSNQGGGGDGWRFGTNGTNLRFTTLGAQDITQTASLVAGNWNHLAVTINNDVFSFYINGNLAGTQTTTVNYVEEETGFEVKLGGKATGAENMFGRMDDVKLFDNVLTQSEIVAAAAAVPEPSSTALLGLGTLGLILRRRR